MFSKLSLLKDRNIFLVMSGLFISVMFSAIYSISTAIYIADIASSLIFLGGYISIPFFVNLFVSPLAGKICDRYSRKWIIVISDLVSGILMLITGIIYTIYNDYSIFYITALFLTIFSIFFQHSIFGLIKEITDEKHLFNVNALSIVILRTVGILGLLFGAILVNKVPITFIIYLNGFSFIISAFFELFIKSGYVKEKTQTNKSSNSGISLIEFLKIENIKLLLVITISTSLVYNLVVKIGYLVMYAKDGKEIYYSILLITLMLSPLVGNLIYSTKNKPINLQFKIITIIGLILFFASNLLSIGDFSIITFGIQIIVVSAGSIMMSISATLTRTILHKKSTKSNASSMNAYFLVIAHVFTPFIIILYSYMLDLKYFYALLLLGLISFIGILVTFKYDVYE